MVLCVKDSLSLAMADGVCVLLFLLQAVSQARAGADCVSPSDMMDGRVGAIRCAPVQRVSVGFCSGGGGLVHLSWVSWRTLRCTGCAKPLSLAGVLRQVWIP